MDSHYAIGVIVASLCGIVYLWYNRKRIRDSTGAKKPRDEGFQTSVDGAGGTDIIIVGAGVAGSALAHTLAKDGRQVHVIERDLSEPDRIAGEVLQPGGYLKLVELGLEDCVNEIDAQQLLGWAFYLKGESAEIADPLKKFPSDVYGRGFHNGRFVQRLRAKAASLPNVKLEQGTATSLLEDNGTIIGVRYNSKSGEDLKAYAPLTIVCDGCFSNLRRTLTKSKVEVHSCAVALALEGCQLPFPDSGHFILADPSPTLFYPISSTEVRCIVDVPGQNVPSIANGEMANYLKSVVAPQVPPEFYSSLVAAIDKGNIRTMPTRSMPADPLPTPGALLMGDTNNMRHPITGGGMTVALADVVVLRDLLRPLKSLNGSSEMYKYVEAFYELRKPGSSTINTLAGVLYVVFCAPTDQVRKTIRQACFDYLTRGRVFSSELVATFYGLDLRPWILLLHLFAAVALYGVGRLLLPFPSLRRTWIAFRLIPGAVGIIFPIIKAEGVRQMFFPVHIAPHANVK